MSVRINLLPPDNRRAAARKDGRRSALGAAGVVVMAAVGIGYGSLFLENRVLAGRVQEAEISLTTVRELEGRSTSIKAREEKLEQVKTEVSGPRWSAILTGLAGLTPSSITLRDVNAQGDMVTMTGMAPTVAALVPFVKGLGEQRGIRSAELRRATARGVGGGEAVEFEIIVRLGS